MPNATTYTQQAVARIADDLPGILAEFRKRVAADVTSDRVEGEAGELRAAEVRIDWLEFAASAREMILATMPATDAWMTAFLAKEPSWLYVDIWRSEHSTPFDAIRAAVADRIVEDVSGTVREILADQFADVDLDSIVGAARDAARRIRSAERGVGPLRADQLDAALDMLEASGRPNSLALLDPLMNAADVMERSVSAADARRLRELGAFVNGSYAEIDAAAARNEGGPRR